MTIVSNSILVSPVFIEVQNEHEKKIARETLQEMVRTVKFYGGWILGEIYEEKNAFSVNFAFNSLEIMEYWKRANNLK